jgi:hypothetical protein
MQIRQVAQLGWLRKIESVPVGNSAPYEKEEKLQIVIIELFQIFIFHNPTFLFPCLRPDCFVISQEL